MNFFAKFKVDRLDLNCVRFRKCFRKYVSDREWKGKEQPFQNFGIPGNEAVFPHIINLARNAKYMQMDYKCDIPAKELCLLREVRKPG